MATIRAINTKSETGRMVSPNFVDKTIWTGDNLGMV